MVIQNVTYIVELKMNVPKEIADSGIFPVIDFLREEFYCLAGSNDGSEFLANIRLTPDNVKESKHEKSK